MEGREKSTCVFFEVGRVEVSKKVGEDQFVPNLGMELNVVSNEKRSKKFAGFAVVNICSAYWGPSTKVLCYFVSAVPLLNVFSSVLRFPVCSKFSRCRLKVSFIERKKSSSTGTFVY